MWAKKRNIKRSDMCETIECSFLFPIQPSSLLSHLPRHFPFHIRCSPSQVKTHFLPSLLFKTVDLNLLIPVRGKIESIFTSQDLACSRLFRWWSNWFKKSLFYSQIKPERIAAELT